MWLTTHDDFHFKEKQYHCHFNLAALFAIPIKQGLSVPKGKKTKGKLNCSWSVALWLLLILLLLLVIIHYYSGIVIYGLGRFCYLWPREILLHKSDLRHSEHCRFRYSQLFKFFIQVSGTITAPIRNLGISVPSPLWLIRNVH